MTRRGQCRCGAILHFHKTPQGYKTRCFECQAVVRLRADAPPAERPGRVLGSGSRPRRATVPSPPTHTSSFEPDEPLALTPAAGMEVADTDFTTPPLPDESAKLQMLPRRQHDAPSALAEMPTYSDAEPSAGVSLAWWLTGAALLLVVAATTAVMFLP